MKEGAVNKGGLTEALVNHLQNPDADKGKFLFTTDHAELCKDMTSAGWMDILKAPVGTDSNILFEIVAQCELSLLTHIVGQGGFHYAQEGGTSVDIDLNKPLIKHDEEGKEYEITAYEVCVDALSKCEDDAKRAELEGVLSILEAGGVDTWVANFLYNLNNKSAITARLAKKGVEKVAGAVETVNSVIPDAAKGGAVVAASAIASASTYLLGAAYNSLPESEYVNYMKELYGAVIENGAEFWEKADKSSLQDIYDLVNAAYEKSYESLPAATRISNWENRSKVLANGGDKYRNLLKIVKHASAQKIEESFFWMSRQVSHILYWNEVAAKDFATDEVKKAFIDAAAANTRAPQAGVIVLKQFFARNPNMTEHTKKELIFLMLSAAREKSNGKLIDELYNLCISQNIQFNSEEKEAFYGNIKTYDQYQVISRIKSESTSQGLSVSDLGLSFVSVNDTTFADVWDRYKQNPSISIAALAMKQGSELAGEAGKIGRQDIIDELAIYNPDIKDITCVKQANNEDYYKTQAMSFTSFMAEKIAEAAGIAAQATAKVVIETVTPTGEGQEPLGSGDVGDKLVKQILAARGVTQGDPEDDRKEEEDIAEAKRRSSEEHSGEALVPAVPGAGVGLTASMYEEEEIVEAPEALAPAQPGTDENKEASTPPTPEHSTNWLLYGAMGVIAIAIPALGALGYYYIRDNKDVAISLINKGMDMVSALENPYAIKAAYTGAGIGVLAGLVKDPVLTTSALVAGMNMAIAIEGTRPSAIIASFIIGAAVFCYKEGNPFHNGEEKDR
ncbi:MAG: hypothetical protein K0R73_542 [Candidatus Midichloriaceae bacterium]|jgi:hypothetical protein|nr:hypothetical protein [Candidatus Midichloriaceae bacterium]